MKISKFHIQNFRSHADTELILAPLTIIRGANNSGKSGIESALEFIFTSRCTGTDERGAGAVDLIRSGEKKATIEASIVTTGPLGGYEATCHLSASAGRKLNFSSIINGFNAVETMQLLESKRDILGCLINGRRFVDLEPAKQKALLASIVLPDTYEWADWVADAVKKTSLMVNWNAKPVEMIAAAYKSAYDERTGVNRDIKNFRVVEGDTKLAGMTEDVEKILGERKVLLADLQQKKGAHEATVKGWDANLSRAEDRLQKAQASLSGYQQEVKTHKAAILSKKTLKEHAETAKDAAKAEELQGKINTLQATLSVKQSAREEFFALAKKGECPTCTQTITEEAVKAIGQPLIDEIERLQDRVTEAQNALQRLGDYTGAAKAVAAHNQAVLDVERARDRAVEAQGEIEKAQTELDGLSNPGAALAPPSDEEIAEAQAKVDSAQNRLTAVKQANSNKEAQDKGRLAMKALEERKALLEKLVTYFGAEGVLPEMLGKYVGGFTDSMNAVLASWDYHCTLSFEPYSFSVSQDEGVAHELHLLSKSQRYRFSIAFQVALAKVSGFNFVVIDEADMLDAPNHKNLIAALRGAGLDQAIVLQTDLRMEAPAVEGVVFYALSSQMVDGVETTSVRQIGGSK